MSRRKLISTFGDTNFLDYGGGIIYRQGDRHYMMYFEPRYWLTEDENTPEKWFVYEAELDPVFIDWVDFNAIAKTCGLDANEIKQWLNSGDPLELSGLFEAAALYYGWGGLDLYPTTLTKTELRKRYGRWVD